MVSVAVAMQLLLLLMLSTEATPLVVLVLREFALLGSAAVAVRWPW
jgi:hypothetical protein